MKSFTIEQIRKYIESKDSLGDVAFYLSEEAIEEANKSKENEKEDKNVINIDGIKIRLRKLDFNRDVIKKVGIVRTNYHELVRIFGFPNMEVNNNVAWGIYEDETEYAAIIYINGKGSKFSVVDWNVKGEVELIEDILSTVEMIRGKN